MGPIVRIIARYLAGALVAVGLLLPDEASSLINDPEFLAALGVVIGFLVEAAYAFAKKRGWAT